MKKDNAQTISKIIVIAGPTASGKSDLAVMLAKKFNGEIISADSRQVYRELNIGTGKITKKEMRGVPHYMLDVASARRAYSAAQYAKNARKIIRTIIKNKKLPIIVGGTGFWIDVLLGKISLPDVAPNRALREHLSKKSAKKLFIELKKIDPRRAKTIDKHNPRRLIRAIEVARALGHSSKRARPTIQKYNALFMGINPPENILKKNISARTQKMLRRGLIAEIQRLNKSGISSVRFRELGFEYSIPLEYLKKIIKKEGLVEALNQKTFQYAKRQKTWFKRNTSIMWIKNTREATFAVKKFLA